MSLTDKWSNPFARTTTFRPSMQMGSGAFAESQVRPFPARPTYPDSKPTNNYSLGYNYKYSNLGYEGTSSPYTGTDYNSSKHIIPGKTHRDTDNLGSLLDRNPFKRVSLLNQGETTYEPISHRGNYAEGLTPTRDTPYQVKYPSDRSDTTSVHTYINKINDLDDGKSTYNQDYEYRNNPFTRRNLLTYEQSARDEGDKDYGYGEYAGGKFSQNGNTYAGYEHLLYHPTSYKKQNNFPVETGINNYSETSIDKYAKSLKNIEPEQKYLKYRQNAEDDYRRDGENYYKSSFDYDGQKSVKKSMYQEDYQPYLKPQENKSYRREDFRKSDYDREEQQYPRPRKFTHDIEYKKDEYRIKTQENFTPSPIQNRSSVEKFVRSRTNIQEDHVPPRKQQQYERQNFYRHRVNSSDEQNQREHSPSFKNPHASIPSKNVVRFENQDDDDEQEHERPVYGSNFPSNLQIRGKVYHRVHLSNDQL